MKRLFSIVPAEPGGRIVVLGMLGMTAMLLNPGAEACGPDRTRLPTLHCPVAGLGKDVQPTCCPNTPMAYWYKIYCTYEVTLNSRHFADYKGGKVYFCCDKCVPIFQKAPEKFAANANLQLFATRQAKQVLCPLCGGEVKTYIPVEVGGVEVGVCSATCRKNFERAKPVERLQLVFSDAAFARGFVMNVKKAAPAQKSAASLAPSNRGGCCCQP